MLFIINFEFIIMDFNLIIIIIIIIIINYYYY